MQKRKTKKFAVLSLSMLFAGMTVLTACSSDKKEQAGQSAAPASSSAPAKAGNLKVELWDRGNPPEGVTITNSFLTNYIKDNFGKPNNINVDFVPVPRSEEVPKLNILMASNTDVPDIVITYDKATFNKYASQGGLTEVTDLVKQYGPNLSKFLGDDIMKIGQFKGKQYAIPAKRATTGKYASFIRQDWLDKLNLKAPNTTDELYNVLKAFKEKDPGATGGKVVPLGMSIAPAQYEPLIWSFIDNVSDQTRFEQTQTLASRDYPILLPGFKEAVKFMNKLYNEGLMSQDFALDKKKETLVKDIANGKVGFFSEDNINIFYNDGTYDSLKKNVPTAVLTPVDSYTNKDGKHTKPISAPNGMYIMIPQSSKNAVEAVKYLDWMSTGDNLLTILKGVKGQNYNLDSNGIPVIIDNPAPAAKNNTFSGGDLGILANGLVLDTQKKSDEAFVKNFPERYQADTRKALEISNTDGVAQVNTPRPIDAESKYGTTLLTKAEELIVKATMAKPNEFEAVFDSMMKGYMSSGGQAVLDERKAAWKEIQTK
ncbi:putative aldouronate transport system substrate-binding protein [Paenibacillus sp. V4I3]|uniref:extracellular solute-binding protein n=1 Tax=unclassified Paenibacillus TaxID=185978 RepID=UPI0027846D28|nr:MULTISPECIES: extracellular solute-binding protein [unclassified Paenibacillus]MDQ0877786.1 putative aldouronate transport system substrate-binding protein [Paenibacillus sp. V4I3]MDQ0886340.1 putative aldouronate transport system substrate-binding protein [Paenibacillus sp. V4I9]